MAVPSVKRSERKAAAATVVHKAKTAKGKRALQAKAPKLEEDAKNILILQGTKVSQVVKDVLLDVNKLKKLESVRYTRANEVRPFEAGGEASLQFFCQRSDCTLFCLGQHSKKRPHNLVLGRMFDNQVLDMLEFGITKHTAITQCRGSSAVAMGNQPCFLFIGDQFESNEGCKLAKSLLMDTFKGTAATEANLLSLDHVMAVFATSDTELLIRHYSIKLKKSGTRIPRVELQDMGPFLDLQIRRQHHAPADLAKEAHTHPKLGKKKQKNVNFEELEGKVGRIYMPKQDIATVNASKGKGLKRERRAEAAERKGKKHQKSKDAPAEAGAGGDAAMDE